jgi:Tfp pilus assembly protein PilF
MGHALEHTRQGLAIYPKNLILRNNLALFAMYASDFDTAAQQAKNALELNPSFRKAHVALALSQLAIGLVEEARDRYRELAKIGDREASAAEAGLADIGLYEGRHDEVAARLASAVRFDLEKGFANVAARKLVMLAEARFEAGDTPSAIQSMERALSHSQGVEVVFPASRLFLETGNRQRARGFAGELASRAQIEPRAYGKLIEGEAALADSDPQEAVRILLESKDLADSWLTRFALGRAYLEAGAFVEAHAQLELCLKRRGEATAAFLDEEPTYHYLPPVYYYLGRAQEGLKDPAARESYRTFLSIKEPGQDTDLVADARRRAASQK